MPYRVEQRGDQWCVFTHSEDGSAGQDGELVDGGCHASRAEAEAHATALRINVHDGRDEARRNGKGEKAVTLQRADIYVPITKVDKTPEGHRIVTGVAASERLDLDGQRADYDWAKTALGEWFKWGNVREQHGRIAAGKGISIEFDDKGRAITVVSKAVDQGTIQKLDEGILTGYSWGARSAPGNPIRVKKDADGGERVVGGKIIELSYVDHPCNYDCVIQVAKMAKGGKVRETAQVGELDGLDKLMSLESGSLYDEPGDSLEKAKLKAKQRNALSSSSFAVPGKRKLPIHDAAHVRNAMARFNQTQDLTPAEKATARRKIMAAARRFGIDTSGFAGGSSSKDAAGMAGGCGCCDDCGPDCQGDCCDDCTMQQKAAVAAVTPAGITSGVLKLAGQEADPEFSGLLQKVGQAAARWSESGRQIPLPAYTTLADLARAAQEADLKKRRTFYSGQNRAAVEQAMQALHQALGLYMEGAASFDVDKDQRDSTLRGQDAPSSDDQPGGPGSAPGDGVSGDGNLNWDPSLVLDGDPALRTPSGRPGMTQDETGTHSPAPPAGRAPGGQGLSDSPSGPHAGGLSTGDAGRGERLPSASGGDRPRPRGIYDSADPELVKQRKKLKRMKAYIAKMGKARQPEPVDVGKAVRKALKQFSKQQVEKSQAPDAAEQQKALQDQLFKRVKKIVRRSQDQKAYPVGYNLDQTEKIVQAIEKSAAQHQPDGQGDTALLAELVRAAHRQQVDLTLNAAEQTRKDLRKQARRVAGPLKRVKTLRSEQTQLRKQVEELGRLPHPGGPALSRPQDKQFPSNDTIQRSVGPDMQIRLAVLNDLTKSADHQIARDAKDRIAELLKDL